MRRFEIICEVCGEREVAPEDGVTLDALEAMLHHYDERHGGTPMLFFLEVTDA